MTRRRGRDRQNGGKTGGAAYVHHDEPKQLTDDRPEIGKSVSTDEAIRDGGPRKEPREREPRLRED
jgi:hypothetical protein